MADNGVTVAEAIGQAQGRVYDIEFLRNLRRLTMDQLAVYEHQMGLSPTTSEKLLWLKERGPCDEIIAKQVQHIKECRR